VLGDGTAHGGAEHVKALDAELVQHTERVGGHVSEAVRPARLVALAGVAVVEQY
jgi:hypothetical protein